MASFKKLRPAKSKYLFIPGVPTPNGRLHLGHQSGPFLKLDVMARVQRRNGGHAALIGGSDCYESYVLLKSFQTGEPVEEVCSRFHHLIARDLKAIRSDYAVYFDPLDPEYREWFIDFNTRHVEHLVASGKTIVRQEPYLYSPSAQKYIMGCWLGGRCPLCDASSGGYLCENCGTHYRPMDLKEPFSKTGETDIVSVNSDTHYLLIEKPAELYEAIRKSGFPPHFLNMVENYLAHQGPQIRFSSPEKWGIPFPGMATATIPHTVFSYTSLYHFSLFIGELYGQRFGNGGNAFLPDSGVETVVAFGIDNVIPHTVGGFGVAQADTRYKPFDAMLPNFFMSLENAKFSTSRGHAIWTEDFLTNTPVTSDAIRYYLVRVSPEKQARNFSLAEFIELENQFLAGTLTAKVTARWNQLCSGYTQRAMDEKQCGLLEDCLVLQTDFLTPPHQDIARCTEPFETWLQLPAENLADGAACYWWLKGLAMLAWPVMPDFAGDLWRLLGGKNDPAAATFFEETAPDMNAALPRWFTPLHMNELVCCLPDTITQNL